MSFLGLTFDLVDQLGFYGAYHTNHWNKLIHVVFVPGIAWSALVWLAASGPLFGLDMTSAGLPELLSPLSRALSPNLGTLTACAYASYYCTLEPLAGSLWAVFWGVPMVATATAFQAGVENAWAWALGLHVLSWYMQIHPGHIVLEKRRPALMDSLAQSLVLAPFFVWLEILFACGYRPSLKHAMQVKVKARIAAMSDNKDK